MRRYTYIALKISVYDTLAPSSRAPLSFAGLWPLFLYTYVHTYIHENIYIYVI